MKSVWGVAPPNFWGVLHHPWIDFSQMLHIVYKIGGFDVLRLNGKMEFLGERPEWIHRTNVNLGDVFFVLWETLGWTKVRHTFQCAPLIMCLSCGVFLLMPLPQTISYIHLAKIVSVRTIFKMFGMASVGFAWVICRLIIFTCSTGEAILNNVITSWWYFGGLGSHSIHIQSTQG